MAATQVLVATAAMVPKVVTTAAEDRVAMVATPEFRVWVVWARSRVLTGLGAPAALGALGATLDMRLLAPPALRVVLAALAALAERAEMAAQAARAAQAAPEAWA